MADILDKKIDNLKVIVFDLDYTLWPFWVDTHVEAPFRKDPSTGKVYDRHNQHVKLYPDVPKILPKLKELGYQLAVASRTSYTEEALCLLDLFGFTPLFSSIQIYPGRKFRHFEEIAKDTSAKLTEMAFYDDESRNIIDLNTVGVHCVLIENILDWATVREGLQGFVQRVASN